MLLSNIVIFFFVGQNMVYKFVSSRVWGRGVVVGRGWGGGVLGGGGVGLRAAVGGSKSTATYTIGGGGRGAGKYSIHSICNNIVKCWHSHE